MWFNTHFTTKSKANKIIGSYLNVFSFIAGRPWRNLAGTDVFSVYTITSLRLSIDHFSRKQLQTWLTDSGPVNRVRKRSVQPCGR